MARSMGGVTELAQSDVPPLDKKVVSAQLQVVGDVVGAWKSQVLMTLFRLGVFEELREGPRNGPFLSSRLGLPPGIPDTSIGMRLGFGVLEKAGRSIRECGGDVLRPAGRRCRIPGKLVEPGVEMVPLLRPSGGGRSARKSRGERQRA